MCNPFRLSEFLDSSRTVGARLIILWDLMWLVPFHLRCCTLVDGNWANGLKAGLWYWNVNELSSGTWTNVGARLLIKNIINIRDMVCRARTFYSFLSAVAGLTPFLLGFGVGLSLSCRLRCITRSVLDLLQLGFGVLGTDSSFSFVGSCRRLFGPCSLLWLVVLVSRLGWGWCWGFCRCSTTYKKMGSDVFEYQIFLAQLTLLSAVVMTIRLMQGCGIGMSTTLLVQLVRLSVLDLLYRDLVCFVLLRVLFPLLSAVLGITQLMRGCGIGT